MTMVPAVYRDAVRHWVRPYGTGGDDILVGVVAVVALAVIGLQLCGALLSGPVSVGAIAGVVAFDVVS